MKKFQVSPSALIEDNVAIGEGSRIWHNAHIRSAASIGRDCVIGENVYIGTEVRIGDNCKIQNGAQIYEPAILENGVFVGPHVVLTNDRVPRAITPDGQLKSPNDWTAVGVNIEEGASIGANATCVAPIRIGRWAMVGAGSVVIRDVPDYALVVGNPAAQIGWVSELGFTLIQESKEVFRCPKSKSLYSLVGDKLKKLDS